MSKCKDNLHLLEFKLQNGLNATLHLTKSPKMEQLLKTRIRRICSELRVDPVSFYAVLFAVEIRIEDESVYMFYWRKFVGTVIRELKQELNNKNGQWTLPFFIIYNNQVYYSNDTVAYESIIQAIIHKIKPSLAALVTP
jgi:hypothetical protein